MAAKNKKCLACGTRYSYCASCSRSDRLGPSWKANFCSEDCMNLWKTLSRYNVGTLSKEEAQDVILGLTMKPIETYVDCVKRDYAKVMEEDKKSRKHKKVVETVEEIIAEPIEEIAIEHVFEEIIIEPIVEVSTPVMEEIEIIDESHEVVIIENE